MRLRAIHPALGVLVYEISEFNGGRDIRQWIKCVDDVGATVGQRLMSKPVRLPFAASPQYGRGVMYRRILITASAGAVLAELEDHAHAMRCWLHHVDGKITKVEAAFLRFPLSTCPSADRPLAELVGTPVQSSSADFFAHGRARRNCTHVLDLAWLAARHAARKTTVRDYLITIPDAPDGQCEAVLERDGSVVLQWRLDGDHIVGSPPFDGALSTGFVSRVLSNPLLAEDMIEAALVLHKGWFVRRAREFTLPVGPIGIAEREAAMGACHGYAVESIGTAMHRANQFRDFSAHPERLLRFL